MAEDKRLVTVIFPDGTVLKCEKLIYGAGNVERQQGEWEHGHYGEFDVNDIAFSFEQISNMFVSHSQEILEAEGIDVDKYLSERKE